MEEKYVKLKHVEELLNLIERRNAYYDWSGEYEKLDRKVERTTDWLKRNAVEIKGAE